jgi:hypothetical protein
MIAMKTSRRIDTNASKLVSDVQSYSNPPSTYPTPPITSPAWAPHVPTGPSDLKILVRFRGGVLVPRVFTVEFLVDKRGLRTTSFIAVLAMPPILARLRTKWRVYSWLRLCAGPYAARWRGLGSAWRQLSRLRSWRRRVESHAARLGGVIGTAARVAELASATAAARPAAKNIVCFAFIACSSVWLRFEATPRNMSRR